MSDPAPESRSAPPPIIKVSPALVAWIHRTPSRRVSVHRDRYRPGQQPPPAPQEDETGVDGG